MRNRLATLLMLLIASVAFGANTHIKGNIGQQSFKSLQVKVVNDFLTNTHEKIAEINIDANGNFSFDIEIDRVTYVLLDFGKLKRHFYAEPNQNYEVGLGVVNPNLNAVNSVYEIDEQPAYLIGTDSTELNHLMIRLEADLARYSLDHLNDLLKTTPKKQLDALSDSLRNEYPLDHSEFFKTQFDYSIAALYQFVYRRGKDLFQAAYFIEKPVHSDNPAYMKLFKMQFEKYFKMEYSKPERKYLLDYLNKNQYPELLESIYPLAGPQDKELRELVLLHAIYENWGNGRVNPKSVEYHLAKLIETTASETNKLTATNIQRKLMELAPGSDAPDFALYDLDSNLFMLSALRGKYVYLNFTESWSKNFDLDSRVMMSWKTKLPELEVVSVMVDTDEDLVKAYLEKERPNWTVLYAGQNPAILLDYKLSTYPIYFLIGPDGKIILSPAKTPYEGFENQFKSITQ